MRLFVEKALRGRVGVSFLAGEVVPGEAGFEREANERRDANARAEELDDQHLLVREDAIDMIQRKVEELQASNSFSRPDAAAEKQDEQRPAKQRKKKATN